jgi:transposase-like protein
MAGKRRQFTLEFKLEAVQLASTSKKPLAQVGAGRKLWGEAIQHGCVHGTLVSRDQRLRVLAPQWR